MAMNDSLSIQYIKLDWYKSRYRFTGKDISVTRLFVTNDPVILQDQFGQQYKLTKLKGVNDE